MQLRNTFTVPVPVERTWPVLLDLGAVAPCMPGAEVVAVDGDDLTGRVKVKLGPIRVGYEGTIRLVEKDEAAHRAVLHAAAKESRGSGTARATIAAELSPAADDSTSVAVVTELDITGRPAQFGRGVMADVSDHILRQFADNLSARLAAGADGAGTGVAAPGTATSAATPTAAPAPVPATVPPAAVTAPAAAGDLDALALLLVPLRRHAPALVAGAIAGALVGAVAGRLGGRTNAR